MATNVAAAHPSKQFFVGMLTRDIELQDAILDLLDNCIDGVLRSNRRHKPNDKGHPYRGYHAKLTIEPRLFEISDNCGGIPREVAEEYAFRLGRPNLKADKDLATVGMYGIGMKRALFKLGRNSWVASHHQSDRYMVEISESWLADDDDWELPIIDLSRGEFKELSNNEGTVIRVEDLLPAVSKEFDAKKSDFLRSLRTTIATHYSYIIYKGFSISINGINIEPRSIGLLISKSSHAHRIAPFVYETEYDEVKVYLAVGFYRSIPTDAEVEQELEAPIGGSKESAGWTVICNDRVVVYSDKSRMTGWGEAGVPAFHPQFIAIAGVVRFRSTNALKLPVTTTKRGIDAGSDLYLAVKDVMREGTKHFTNFTNRWKASTNERAELLKKSEPIDVFRLRRELPASGWHDVRKGLLGRKYVPNLPTPSSDSSEKQIRFTRPVKEIRLVSDFLFNDPEIESGRVGERCFESVLVRAKR